MLAWQDRETSCDAPQSFVFISIKGLNLQEKIITSTDDIELEEQVPDCARSQSTDSKRTWVCGQSA